MKPYYSVLQRRQIDTFLCQTFGASSRQQVFDMDLGSTSGNFYRRLTESDDESESKKESNSPFNDENLWRANGRSMFHCD